jgi:uncharacterized membrane protein YeiH
LTAGLGSHRLIERFSVSAPIIAAIQSSLDLLSVFAFAALGGLVAARKRLPLLVIVLFAALSALGGGLVRDLIIGASPVATRLDYIVAAAAGAVLVALRHVLLERVIRPFETLEALGLSLFALVGTVKTTSYGHGPALAVLLGVVSAVGGGIVRDLFLVQRPVFLRADRLLLVAPVLLVSVLTAAVLQFDALNVISAATVILVGFAALLLAQRYNAVAGDTNRAQARGARVMRQPAPVG